MTVHPKSEESVHNALNHVFATGQEAYILKHEAYGAYLWSRYPLFGEPHSRCRMVAALSGERGSHTVKYAVPVLDSFDSLLDEFRAIVACKNACTTHPTIVPLDYGPYTCPNCGRQWMEHSCHACKKLF